MSYEGYEQHLCSYGHYFIVDAYEGDYYAASVYIDDKHAISCQVVSGCLGSSIWHNSVDETNGENAGFIDMRAFMVSSEVLETCNLGHRHIQKAATYRIPSTHEMETLRTYQDNGVEKYMLSDIAVKP